jgi:fatty-acyl-CoA synthase
MYAASKAGLILVNINPAYRPAELEYALAKVGCSALVLASSFKTSNYVEMIRGLVPEADTSAPGSIVSEKLPTLKSLILIEDEPLDGFFNYSQVQSMGEKSDLDLSEIADLVDPDDAVNIQFTSGTTGSPKGATLTHNNIVNNAYFIARGLKMTPQDKVCSPVPLYHCFGMVLAVLACATAGATVVLPDESFDPLSTLEAVEAEKCTALYGVPTMFNMVLDHPQASNFDVSSLRTGIVAGAVCPESIMKRILAELNMHEVVNAYGMTETSPASFQTATDDNFIKRTTTVGRVHPNVEVKVIDDNGDICPIGVPGELCVKGYNVMQGYWGDEKRTNESIIDGWMLTGDQAVFDHDGYASIVGRIKDTIIRGGENIAPTEIEDFLLEHPSILEAQAFGVKDERFGEIVAVWLKADESAQLTEQAVKDYCKDQISHFKVPSIVMFVDEFPMTVTGKIQKFIMREETEKQLAMSK